MKVKNSVCWRQPLPTTINITTRIAYRLIVPPYLVNCGWFVLWSGKQNSQLLRFSFCLLFYANSTAYTWSYVCARVRARRIAARHMQFFSLAMAYGYMPMIWIIVSYKGGLGFKLGLDLISVFLQVLEKFKYNFNVKVGSIYKITKERKWDVLVNESQFLPLFEHFKVFSNNAQHIS